MKIRAGFLIAFLAFSVHGLSALAQTQHRSGQASSQKYWIFFKDKPEASQYLSSHTVQADVNFLLRVGVISRRALQVRAKVLPQSKLISVADFPVSGEYLDSIRNTGLNVVGTSRWFNAAVVIADSAGLLGAERFPFVVGIKRIIAFTDPVRKILPIGAKPPLAVSAASPQASDSSFYGPSLPQYELSGIPEVHSLGINGRGIVIGMIDAGFRWETHDALDHIKIDDEYDFIQHDSVTENQPQNNPPDAPDQDNHGTSTLSVIGGYDPGNIVGVSYGSSFILAKTEYVPVTDFKWEEDNWVEGLEWMESLGVDVVSSSVAYNIFVDSSGAVDSAESYFFSRGDFNGKTAISSRAATRAAELGVVVVQAAGNEGHDVSGVGTLDVPGDADSIITVGAVDFTGQLAGFSSVGPTNDGRIKPDLVADGTGDYVATVPGPDTYAYESGTSFSTPIVAGIASLILSARPDYTPMQVINLLKNSAYQYHNSLDSSTFSYPNNYYGWGIANAWNAVRQIGFVGSNYFVSSKQNGGILLAIKAFSTSGINPALSRAYYSYDGLNFTSAPVFPTDTTDQFAFLAPAPANPRDSLHFYFELADSTGKILDVPYYGSAKPFALPGWQATPLGTELFHLYDAYPNPFTKAANVGFILSKQSSVQVDVFDVLGRKVKTVFHGNLPSGYMQVSWDGTTGIGTKASSGVYFIRIEVDGTSKVAKVLYLR